MIKVAVSGCFGRMGSAVIDAVSAADDMEVACGIDPFPKEGASFTVYSSREEAVAAGGFDVVVDFTQPSVIEGNLRCALPAGIDCVVGTTGLSDEKLTELAALAPSGTCLFYAPNFTTGAVLMMEFAKAAAPYFPEAEVIEMHHCNKKDALRAPPCARRRSSQMREGAARARHPGPRRSFQEPKVRAVRSSRVFRCTPCARWASLRARRSSSDRWGRRSPSATTPGIERPTCPAFCWVSGASVLGRA